MVLADRLVTHPPYRQGMKAFAPLREDADRDQSKASDECSLWRGRFIEEYSSAEAVVSEALAHLSTIATSGAESLLPHLVGKRFEALGIVVGRRGPLAAVGSRVTSALDEFRDLHGYRTFLCHGSSAITIDPSGRWRLVLNLTSFRAATVQRTSIEIGEDEAAVVLARLRHARRRLDGQLRGMLASFR
jgi:hypothetical protein